VNMPNVPRWVAARNVLVGHILFHHLLNPTDKYPRLIVSLCISNLIAFALWFTGTLSFNQAAGVILFGPVVVAVVWTLVVEVIGGWRSWQEAIDRAVRAEDEAIDRVERHLVVLWAHGGAVNRSLHADYMGTFESTQLWLANERKWTSLFRHIDIIRHARSAWVEWRLRNSPLRVPSNKDSI